MIDLNLLRIFDAVMTERHVGRAALLVSRTQPAVSNALTRLRQHFDDPLFLRSGDGMRPTAKAESIWRELAPAFETLSRQSQTQQIGQAQLSGDFIISCTDFESNLFLRTLHSAFSKQAASVNLVFRPGGGEKSISELNAAHAHLALGFVPDAPTQIRRRLLFEDSFTVLMQRSHPFANQSLTLKRYATATHVVVSPSGQRHGFVDDELMALGLARRVSLVVNQFGLLHAALQDADVIATVSKRNANQLLAHTKNFICKPVPIKLPPARIHAYWHRRADADQRLAALLDIALATLQSAEHLK